MPWKDKLGLVHIYTGNGKGKRPCGENARLRWEGDNPPVYECPKCIRRAEEDSGVQSVSFLGTAPPLELLLGVPSRAWSRLLWNTAGDGLRFSFLGETIAIKKRPLKTTRPLSRQISSRPKLFIVSLTSSPLGRWPSPL